VVGGRYTITDNVSLGSKFYRLIQ